MSLQRTKYQNFKNNTYEQLFIFFQIFLKFKKSHNAAALGHLPTNKDSLNNVKPGKTFRWWIWCQQASPCWLRLVPAYESGQKWSLQSSLYFSAHASAARAWSVGRDWLRGCGPRRIRSGHDWVCDTVEHSTTRNKRQPTRWQEDEHERSASTWSVPERHYCNNQRRGVHDRVRQTSNWSPANCVGHSCQRVFKRDEQRRKQWSFLHSEAS